MTAASASPSASTRLWQFTRGVRGRIAWAVALGVLSASVGVARFALLGWLLGRLYAGEALEALVPAMLGVAAVMLARGFLEAWRASVAHRTAAIVQRNLRAALFDNVVALGPAWFGTERTGDALLTMVEGVEQLEIYFGEFLPQLLVAAITPLVVFALLAGFDLPLAALLLAFAWFTMLAPTAFQSWDAAASLRRRDAYHAFAAEFLDAIQGLATLKAFGQAGARARLLRDKADEVFRSTMWVLATNSLTRGITDTGIAVGAAVALTVGAYRVEAGETTMAVLLMVLMAGVETFRPQRDLRTLLHDGMVGLSAAQGVFRLLEARPAIRWPGASSPGDASIAFERVTFAYPDDDGTQARAAAHRELDFHAAAGQRVGFVGASGAGKSTIVKLLLRQYDAQGGTVRVGGVPVAELCAPSLYRQFAVVSQDTYLFHGTVAENLRLGKPDASDSELVEATATANAAGFIAALPDGLNTVVGERGMRLSGGQRQRIAIARALLRNAPVLVLDEALSAVDARNEAVIAQALARLSKGRTTLVFAHRLSSVKDCDVIHVLEHGAIVESGTHDVLLRDGPHYRALMAAQLEGDQDASAAGEAASDAARPVPLAATDGAPAAANGAGHKRPAALPGEASLPGDGAPAGSPSGSQAAELGWPGALRVLGRLARPWWLKLTGVFVLGVVRVLAFIGVGVLSAMVVMRLRAGEPFEPLLPWLFVLAPAAGIVHWLESWLAHDMAFRMLSDMRVSLFEKLARIAPAFLLRRRSGDLVAMATHDVELVEYFFAHTIAPAFVAVLVPGVVLGVLGSQHWLLVAALLPFLVFVGKSPMLMRSRIDLLASRARDSLSVLNAHVVDSVQGLNELVAFQAARPRRTAFLAQADAHGAARLPFLHSLGWQHAALEVAVGLGGLAVVVAGAALVSSNALEVTVLPVLTVLALAAFLPVSEIAHVGRQLADTLGAPRRLEAVHREPEPIRDGAGAQVKAATPCELVRFDDVSFSYPGHVARALDAVSFSVAPGSMTALVGPSGAGKSTAAQLCLRFFDPSAGTVRLFGADARQYTLADLRARVALVSQETYLFNDTLEANIRLAAPAASEAELRAAVRRASLEEFVGSLPRGLATTVGERGVRLSGGQRQRIAIARAFLRNAPLLVLDEATSNLDAVSEALVRDSLATLMHDRTTIVIAHRLSTVRSADRIIVLEDGRVAEQGSHEALAGTGGLYAELVATQLAAAGRVATNAQETAAMN